MPGITYIIRFTHRGSDSGFPYEEQEHISLADAWNACRRSVQRISFSSFFMMIQSFQVLRRVYQKKIEDNRYG